MNVNSSGNVIVLAIDRLGSGFWGPYGNTWLETPTANRFAADGVVIEYATTDSVDLQQVYWSYWTGRSVWQRQRQSAASWLDQLSLAQRSSWLLTDEEAIAYHPLASHFQQRDYTPQDDPECAADSADGTGLTQSFARWMARLETLEPPFLAWIHTRGMQGAWDAPWEYRWQIADPDDPPPPTSVNVPQADLRGQEVDPDLLWGLTCAYAGQVMLLDECIEMLLQFLETQPWGDDTTVIITSPRGFPLGEHGIVGDAAEMLRAEATHVPLLMRAPLVNGKRAGALRRCPFLIQPADLGRWIGQGLPWCPDWLETDLHAPEFVAVTQPPQEVITLGLNHCSLRTRHWSYVTDWPLPAEPQGSLYVKPDDRWDFNDVAERATADVQAMHDQLCEQLRIVD